MQPLGILKEKIERPQIFQAAVPTGEIGGEEEGRRISPKNNFFFSNSLRLHKNSDANYFYIYA